MPKILLTEEGKRVQIDPTQDTELYDSPQNPPDTGIEFTRGVDLYAHKARSGKWYFYFRHWSMWQGEAEEIYLINKDEAIGFLQQKAAASGPAEISEKEMRRAVEILGEDIFSETA